MNSQNIDLKVKVQSRKLPRVFRDDEIKSVWWSSPRQCQRYHKDYRVTQVQVEGNVSASGVSVFSSSQVCCCLWPSSSCGGSWEGSSSGSRAVESEAVRQTTQKQSLVRTKLCDTEAKRSIGGEADLWLLTLHTPDAVWTVHDRVLRHDLARVHLAARADDAPTGQDHVSPEISWDLTSTKGFTFGRNIFIWFWVKALKHLILNLL